MRKTNEPRVAPRRHGTDMALDPAHCAVPDHVMGQYMENPARRFADYPGAAADQVGQVFVWGRRDDGKLYDFAAGIAVIEIKGPLFNDGFIDLRGGRSGYKGIAVQFEAALADPDVTAILFDIDSPGGVANGCFDLVDQISSARGPKPIWAFANDLATSGAYAIAAAADRIVMPRLGFVGSIGVWTVHFNMKRMLDDIGIEATLIWSGAHKVDGHPFGPLGDGVEADIQARIDRTRQLFAETVARDRGRSVAEMLATEARVYSDDTAIEAGLADAIVIEVEVVPALLDLAKANSAPVAQTAA